MQCVFPIVTKLKIEFYKKETTKQTKEKQELLKNQNKNYLISL